MHSSIKVTEGSVRLQLPSGLGIPVTFAKLLLSDLAADLRDEDLLAKRIKIWETDAYVNEHDCTGLQIHDEGYGHDMLVIYDGRVAGGWQCEMPDIRISVDDNDYAEVMQRTLSDPGVLATLEKGQRYRFSIIDEVNPKACTRAKAVNIRDYTSPTLLEEDRDKLYYTIRAIQDYREEGRLSNEDTALSPDICNIISASPSQLQSWYRESRYDIIAQFREHSPGFLAFEAALLDFARNGKIELWTARVLEASNHDMRRIDQWRLLLLRIHHEWYDNMTWPHQFVPILKKAITVIDQCILKGERPYEGLAWQSLR